MEETKHIESSARPSSSPPAKKARVNDEPNAKVNQQPQSQIPPPELQAPSVQEKLETAAQDEQPVKTESIASKATAKAAAMSKSAHSNDHTAPILPPMLSPLPSDVEDEIRKLTSAKYNSKTGAEKPHSSLNSPSMKSPKSSKADIQTVSKAGKTGAVVKTEPVSKASKTNVPTKGPQEQKQMTSAIEKGAKDVQPKAIHTPKAASNVLPGVGKAVSTPSPRTTPSDGQKKLRLRISLTIKKKANRKNLSNYLRMKPTPGRNSLFPNQPIEEGDRPASLKVNAKNDSNDRDARIAKKVDQKPGQSKDLKTGIKRGISQVEESNAEPSSKRKAHGLLPQTQKPSTPSSVGTGSPAISNFGSAQKATSTPNTQAQSTVTPAAPTAAHRRTSYTSPHKPKSPSDLHHESQPYQKLAKTLKHAADVYLKKWDQTDESGRKRGIVLGTESVLCFMLAFVLLDTGKNYSDRNSWNSMIHLVSNLQHCSQQLPNPMHLSGLLHQIEAVIRDQIVYADMQKLDRNPLHPDREDNDANVDHIAAEYGKQYHAMHVHAMRANGAWRQGWLQLDTETLTSQYPSTWAKRAHHCYAYGKGRDAVEKDKYTREYNLPLNHMTSGLEAVSFGMNFLAEWSKASGVEWEPKLVL